MFHEWAREGVRRIGVIVGIVGAKGEMLEARVGNCTPVLLELC